MYDYSSEVSISIVTDDVSNSAVYTLLIPICYDRIQEISRFKLVNRSLSRKGLPMIGMCASCGVFTILRLCPQVDC